ncbi:unnamed protein product [Caenorhabditis sp. 36 PRJEB53466]|nr:unnamed protein product [Caenorhabditis sp. 36 PRJEB53466]
MITNNHATLSIILDGGNPRHHGELPHTLKARLLKLNESSCTMEDNRKRNMERRRETSRYAARDRRGKEADIFTELRECVPIVEEGTVTHLDRIALLRVAATICRLRKTAGNVLENELGGEVANQVWTEETIAECLDGFVMIVDSDSSILYVTESVALYLGLTQTDLTGRALKDFLHPSDYDEFDKQTKILHKPPGTEYDATGTDMVFRMKTVISPRGRCLNLKSALYKPVSFLVHSKVSTGGHVLFMQGITIPAGQGTHSSNVSAMAKYAECPQGAFTTRHTCDMRITFVSDQLNQLIKSDVKSFVGTSFYDLVHPADMQILIESMSELFSKGHTRTPYYRLCASNNNLAWVLSECCTINHTTKGQKGKYVMCTHFVLGIQGADESLVVCTDSMPAGMQVDIKKEIDDTRDYIGRQPEIVECVDFTPLIENEDPYGCTPQRIEQRSDMGVYSVTDEYEQRVYGQVSTESMEEDDSDAESDTESIEDSGLAPEFDVELDPIEKMELGEEDFGEGPPSSPPPARYRSAERYRPAATGTPSHLEPTLASTRFVDSAARASRSKTTSSSMLSYGRRAQSSGSRTTASSAQQHNYSPLTEGISQCALNSPPSVKSGQLVYGDSRSMVSSSNSSDSSRRFSAVPSSDSLDVPSAGLIQTTDVFSAMSFADPLAAINETSGTPTLAGCEPILCDDLQWEEPDLSCLAPFVDSCDMLQMDDGITAEFQALYDLPDFTPAAPMVPAAMPVQVDTGSPPAKRMHQENCDVDYNMYTNQYQPFQHEPYWQPRQQQHQQQQSAEYSQFPMLS